MSLAMSVGHELPKRLALLLMAFNCGCNQVVRDGEPAVPVRDIVRKDVSRSRSDAINRAIEVIDKECPTDTAFDIRVRQMKNGGWHFCVLLEPQAPGNQLLISVYDDGTVESIWGY